MKKTKLEKKPQNLSLPKDLQLPLIKSNNQKGNVKESTLDSSKSKGVQKSLDLNSNITEIPKIPNIPNIMLNQNASRDRKSFGSTHITQSTNKTRSKSGNRKKKVFSYKEEINPNNELIKEEVPRISEEKLLQLKEQRKRRLQQEKIKEEQELKLYAEIVEEYKNNRNCKKNKNLLSEINSKNQKITTLKAQKILEEGGMIDAYKNVLSQLCRHGLPSGNVFEYASYLVKNYEKKWKEKKSKMMKEKIEKYFEEKQKELNNALETEGEIKQVNKSLEHREELKFIKSLDKSRSKRNIMPRISSPIFQDNFTSFSRNIIKNYKILRDNKTYQDKDGNININSRKLKHISLEKNKTGIMRKNSDIALISESSDKNGNNNKYKEKENISINNDSNKNISKNRRRK
jgi:hypothetical protein